jgi:hypothetical protein
MLGSLVVLELSVPHHWVPTSYTQELLGLLAALGFADQAVVLETLGENRPSLAGLVEMAVAVALGQRTT